MNDDFPGSARPDSLIQTGTSLGEEVSSMDRLRFRDSWPRPLRERDREKAETASRAPRGCFPGYEVEVPSAPNAVAPDG